MRKHVATKRTPCHTRPPRRSANRTDGLTCGAGHYAAFLDCRADWGPGLHEDGFGLGADDDVDSAAGFAAWVQRRVRLTHPAGTPCPDEKHGSPRWIVPCLADNVASASTIERNGGVLDVIRDTPHGPVRRYWVTLVP